MFLPFAFLNSLTLWLYLFWASEKPTVAAPLLSTVNQAGERKQRQRPPVPQAAQAQQISLEKEAIVHFMENMLQGGKISANEQLTFV